MWWSASWVVTSTFHPGLTVIDKAYLLAAPISSLLELQSKSWVVELELELSAPRELTQSCGSDSAFRKGLITTLLVQTCLHPLVYVYLNIASVTGSWEVSPLFLFVDYFQEVD